MTISGVNKTGGGSITYNGKRIDGLPPHEIVKLGLSQVPEGRRIFSRLSVKENLEMGAYTIKDKSLAEKNLREVYDLFPVLAERQVPAGRDPVRRRTADACDRPRADVFAPAAPLG